MLRRERAVADADIAILALTARITGNTLLLQHWEVALLQDLNSLDAPRTHPMQFASVVRRSGAVHDHHNDLLQR
jgi:hypothetical protein